MELKDTITKEARHSAVVSYSEETSFHGMKYVFRTKQAFPERIFWIIVEICLFMGLGYFVYIAVSRYLQQPIIITENPQLKHIFEIPFPAVTICPANKIQNFDIHEIFTELNKSISEEQFWHSQYGSQLLMATQICRVEFSEFLPKMILLYAKMSNRNLTAPTTIKGDIKRILHEMSPNLTETIYYYEYSSWHDSHLYDHSLKNSKKLFSEIITNDGLCFTFNTISDVLRSESVKSPEEYYTSNFDRIGWDPDGGYTQHVAYPFKAISRGVNKPYGFFVDLSANMSGRSERCMPSNLGYKLILHSPSAYPHTYNRFISLEYGKSYMIAVKPDTISTANTLRSIGPEIRRCYFNDERQLKYYTFYNENNCKLECYANYTLKYFEGFPFSAPQSNNTSVRLLKTHNYGWKLPSYITSTLAYSKMYPYLENSNLLKKHNTDCNCLPECNSIRYDYEILDVDVEMFEASRTIKSDIVHTALELVFEEPLFTGKKRVEEYTFATFISDFGGLLGLFIGGSLISLVELFYFFVIRNVCKVN